MLVRQVLQESSNRHIFDVCIYTSVSSAALAGAAQPRCAAAVECYACDVDHLLQCCNGERPPSLRAASRQARVFRARGRAGVRACGYAGVGRRVGARWRGMRARWGRRCKLWGAVYVGAWSHG